MSAAAKNHPLRRQLGSQHHAVRIDRQHPLSDCVRLVNRRTDSDDAGVVHHYVDGSEPVLNGVKKVDKGLATRHVQTAVDVESQPATRLIDCVLIDIADGSLGAQAVQNGGNGQPETTSRTGNSNDLPRKRHRWCHFSLLGWIERPGAAGSRPMTVSMSCSAVVCHLSQTRWPLDSKLVMPWTLVSSSAP